MNNENLTHKKCHFTDADRDNVRRLSECGMTTREIADILHIGKSSVGYIKSAYAACVNKDYATLRNLCGYVRPTVEWAMRITNTDPSVLNAAPKSEPVKDIVPELAPPPVVPQTITRSDYLAMLDAMLDIRNLLIEIRDVLK
jgi:hypothetical protein